MANIDTSPIQSKHDAGELESIRFILSYLEPKTADDVRLVAAALKIHGTKFEKLFLEWAMPYGRYKSKGLWAKTKADPDALDEAIARQVAAISKRQRFSPMSAEMIEAMLPSSWLVKGVLPTMGLAAIYGPSASGKSFLLLLMAYCIAAGLPFFGHTVKAAHVLIVGLEGESGYRGRVIALQRHSGCAMPEGVRFLLQPFRLTDSQDVSDLAAVCPQGCVVFIDTLNRAAPGMDENSSKDMGAVIEGAKTLQRLIGGLVVLVAHTGKDSAKGLRGHSSLFAALDAAILVSRDGERRSWKIDKAKDGKDGDAHGFRLEITEVGTDEDGEPITSCIVVPMRYEKTNAYKPLSKSQQFGMQTFVEATKEFKATALHISNWRQVFYRMSTAGSDDAKQKAFQRVRSDLVALGKIIVEDDIYKFGGAHAEILDQCARAVLGS